MLVAPGGAKRFAFSPKSRHDVDKGLGSTRLLLERRLPELRRSCWSPPRRPTPRQTTRSRPAVSASASSPSGSSPVPIERDAGRQVAERARRARGNSIGRRDVFGRVRAEGIEERACLRARAIGIERDRRRGAGIGQQGIRGVASAALRSARPRAALVDQPPTWHAAAGEWCRIGTISAAPAARRQVEVWPQALAARLDDGLEILAQDRRGRLVLPSRPCRPAPSKQSRKRGAAIAEERPEQPPLATTEISSAVLEHGRRRLDLALSSSVWPRRSSAKTVARSSTRSRGTSAGVPRSYQQLAAARLDDESPPARRRR